MMAAGGFDGPQTVALIARQTVRELDAAVATPRLLTIKQAAAYCARSGNSSGHLVGQLAACMIVRRLLIDRGDLDRFIDARLREHAPRPPEARPESSPDGHAGLGFNYDVGPFRHNVPP
jgi:hypothetical protein